MKQINMHSLFLPYMKMLSQHDWDFLSTLTTPYQMSLNAACRTMGRFEKLLDKKFSLYRGFWAAERFSGKGYHIHLIIWINDSNLSSGEKKQIIMGCWNQATGVRKASNNKTTKYKNKHAVSYILKDLDRRSIGYGILGDSWGKEK